MIKDAVIHIRQILNVLLLVCILPGCDGEEFVPVPGTTGSEVVFCTATRPLTKTSYGDASAGFQALNWAEGDRISIFSDAAHAKGDESLHCVDYTILTAGGIESGISSPDALIWGIGPHNFYGIYPASSVNPGITVADGVVTATLPKTQAVTLAEGSTQVYLPDMDYAYMYAGLSVALPQPEASLQFKPMYSAFEVEVEPVEESVTLTRFSITAEGKCLSGTYSGTITAAAETSDSSMEFAALPVASPESNGVEVVFDNVTVTHDQPIKFTVFVVPHDFQIDTDGGLTLEFTTVEDGPRRMVLKTTTGSRTFDTNSKFNIKAVEMPVFKMKTVTVLPDYRDPNLLPGVFSVSPTKKVQFTKGNLWWNGTELGLKDQQYNHSTTRVYNNDNDLFYFCNTVEKAVSYYYTANPSTANYLFCDEDHKIDVQGTAGLFVLSRDEWKYLVDSASETVRKGKCQHRVKVTIGTTTHRTALLAPDECLNGYVFDSAKTIYTEAEFREAEKGGVVCIVAAGFRSATGSDGYYVVQGPENADYWSSAPNERLWFGATGGMSVSNYAAKHGFSIRLVSKVIPVE